MNFGEDLSLQVMLAHKLYQQHLSKILNKTDLFQHYQILLLLSRQGGQCTQKQLGDELSIEKSYMVSIVDALIEKGYVTREVNYKDRRSKLIKLTGDTNELISELEQQFEELEHEIADELTWQEKNDCLRVLNKVNDRFKMIAAKENDEMMKPAFMRMARR